MTEQKCSKLQHEITHREIKVNEDSKESSPLAVLCEQNFSLKKSAFLKIAKKPQKVVLKAESQIFKPEQEASA